MRSATNERCNRSFARSRHDLAGVRRGLQKAGPPGRHGQARGPPGRAATMSQGPDPRPGQSSEYIEQQIIEAIATSRYPGRSIKEILPGFYTDERNTNYVWLVILAP